MYTKSRFPQICHNTSKILRELHGAMWTGQDTAGQVKAMRQKKTAGMRNTHASRL